VIVIDACSAVDYLVEDELRGPWVRERIIGRARLHAPHLIDLEVTHALRRLVRLRNLSTHRAEGALHALQELDLTRYPYVDLLDRVWALRANLTAYDAAYVVLAEALDATLVTTDEVLARSTGHRARIESYSG
jgi:predicted nucleic acid-binding protein